MSRNSVRPYNLETIKANLPAKFLELSKEERWNVLDNIERALDIIKLRTKAQDYTLEVIDRERDFRYLLEIIRRYFT